MYGLLNFICLILFSVAFSILYALSVQPARLERRIGEKAYARCGVYRKAGTVPMYIAMVNFILYRWFPLSWDPFPARFPWPYWVNAVVAAVIGIPAVTVMIRGVRDAGSETMSPEKHHTMYGGIYEKIRHPQALGEAPIWIVVAFLLNLPFLAVFSLLYLPVWYWWCLVEERDLLLRYGEAYAEYRKRTGMFLPRKPRKEMKETQGCRRNRT